MALAYLWEYFNEISMGMSMNGMSYPTISWKCLAAWRELMRIDLEPWEWRALLKLGGLRATVLSVDQSKGKK